MRSVLSVCSLIGLLAVACSPSVLLAGASGQALQTSAAVVAAPNSAAARVPLPDLLSRDHIGFDDVGNIYNNAMLDDGGIAEVVGQLETHAGDNTRPKAHRANALLVAGHLHWRHGFLEAAKEAIDRALAG